MLALWIILGLVVLIGLLLIVPLRIFLRYDEEFQFRLKYGPIPIYDSTKPPKEKPEKPEEPKEASAGEEKKKDSGIEKLLNFLGLSEISSIANVKSSIRQVGVVGTLQAVFSAVKKLFSRLFRLVGKGKFKKFRLTILVGDEDGGEAAYRYGQVCAVAFPLAAYLKNVMRFSEQQLDIRCDYELTENVVRFEGQLNYLPWHFVCFLMWLIVNYIKNSFKKEKSQ